MENKKDTLVFFDKIKEKELDNEHILSALQDFETSLFLVADRRWAGVIILLCSSCEKLLKSIINDPDCENFINLIDRFKEINSKRFSDSLLNNVHNLRKLRNDLTHRGYEPEITEDCVKNYFLAGVPFFDSLLRYRFEKDKAELSNDASSWFWEIYRNTRKVISRNGSDFESALRFYSIACYKVQQARYPSRRIFTHPAWVDPYIKYTEENAVDSFEVDQKRRMLACDMVSDCSVKLSENDNSDIKLDYLSYAALSDFKNIECPICKGEEGIIGFSQKVLNEESDQWEFERFTVFCCAENYCDASLTLFTDPEVLDEFFLKQITKQERIKIIQEDFEPGIDIHGNVKNRDFDKEI